MIDYTGKRIIFLSDTHFQGTKNPDLTAFSSFLLSRSDFDIICFLGDIFDIWIGDIKAFANFFQSFIELCSKLQNNGKTIVFIEGNHEYQITKYFGQKLDIPCFSDQLVFSLGKRCICLTHGDQLYGKTLGYSLFRAVTKSPIFAAFVKTVFPGSLALNIGLSIAAYSRSFSSKKPFNHSKVFTFIGTNIPTDVDTLIFGHFHRPHSQYFDTISGKKSLYCVYTPYSGDQFRYLSYDPEQDAFQFEMSGKPL